jgi:hypothetical protein
MSLTPVLGIAQLSANQSQKEVTINDAILALESAGNATLTLNLSTGASANYHEVGATQFSRNFLFKLTNASVDGTFALPNSLNGHGIQRIFVVVNESGHAIDVVINGAQAGQSGLAGVHMPNGSARLLHMDGYQLRVASEAAVISKLTDLLDGPSSYAGSAGKLVRINAGANGFEFAALPLDALSDVDTSGAANGMFLRFLNGSWTPVAIPAGITTFLGLTDVPDGYAGKAGMVVRVNATESGVEFVQPNDMDVDGLPAGGTSGQVLKKNSNADGDASWGDPASSLPSGGTDGQVLGRDQGAPKWIAPPTGIPSGGTAGQLLARNAAGNVVWVDPPVSNAAPATSTSSTQWRIYNDGNRGGDLWGFAEVDVFDAAGTNITDTAAVAASSYYGSDATYQPAKAVDNNLTTNYYASVAESAGGIAGAWFRFTFPSAVSLKTIKLNVGSVAAGYMPKSFRVQFFDGSAWQTALTVTNEPVFTANEERTYTVPTPATTVTTPGTARGAWTLTAADGMKVVSADAGMPAEVAGNWSQGSPPRRVAMTDGSHTQVWITPDHPFAGNTYKDIPFTAKPGMNTVSVRYRTESENGYDWFRVWIDGVQQFQQSGVNAAFTTWTSAALADGPHTLRFSWNSDGSTTAGYQGGIVSEFTYPATVYSSTYNYGDTVTHVGKKWVCLVAKTIEEPGTGEAWGCIDAVNNWYRGTGVPAETLGDPGDYYIDATNKRIYGPKVVVPLTAKAGRYLGFIVDANQATQIPSAGEFKFFDAAGVQVVPTAAFADATQGGYPVSNMIDGNDATFWLSPNSGTTPRAVVWFDFGTSKTIRSYQFKNRQDSFGTNESWKDWRTFITDTVPSAPWTDAIAKVVDTKTGVAWVQADSKTFTVPLAAASSAWANTVSMGSYRFGLFFTTAPTANEVLMMHCVSDAFTLPDDMVGSVAKVETNPASAFVLSVLKNGVAFGTITISTAGVATFVTSAAEMAFAVGDVIKVVAPSAVDATIAGCTVTFKGGM